jgi:exonuclease VII small subunit
MPLLFFAFETWNRIETKVNKMEPKVVLTMVAESYKEAEEYLRLANKHLKQAKKDHPNADRFEVTVSVDEKDKLTLT